MTVNRELFEKVKAHILEEPRRFYMGDYVTTPDAISPWEAPACGTVACIAGWAYLLSVKRPSKDANAIAEDRAVKLLGITLAESHCLFYAGSWPDEYSHRYIDAENALDYTGMAQAAADRIDHFLATGE